MAAHMNITSKSDIFIIELNRFNVLDVIVATELNRH